jgi:hypothetical protein
MAEAALKLFAVSDRPSPQVQPAPPPVPSPGDSGYYGCTKLSADDFAAAVGEHAAGPRPNGGKAAYGDQPSYSNCSYQTDTADPATKIGLRLTVANYPSADAATQALYGYWQDTPARNIPGIGEGAYIFPNGSPAYVAAGPDVVQLDLFDPSMRTDPASLYTTLMRAIASHATNPAPTPTAPVPGPNDLDPCLLTPAEVQAIFHSPPVTVVQRVFADDTADFACSYLLLPALQYAITIDTAGNAALAANPHALQDRYDADRKSFSSATDIPGFALSSAANATGVADLWGFGDNSYVEIADHGPIQSGSSSHPIPATPLLNFPDPIPDLPTSGRLSQGYLASIIPTPGLTSSSVCGTAAIRCAADASKSVTGQGEQLNQ